MDGLVIDCSLCDVLMYATEKNKTWGKAILPGHELSLLCLSRTIIYVKFREILE